MTQYLPPNLFALFAPRDPIPYLPPASKLPHEKKNCGYLGVGSFLKFFEVSILYFINCIIYLEILSILLIDIVLFLVSTGYALLLRRHFYLPISTFVYLTQLCILIEFILYF